MKKFRLEITECPHKFRTEIEQLALVALEKNNGDEDKMWKAIYAEFPPSENTFVDALSISVIKDN